ncbi:MAG TPA: nucleotidyltransferase family protein, partial [Actinomycetes bacterium]
MVEAAVRHGVAGYLQLAMARDPVALSALAREGLSDVCRAQFARHVRLSAELVQVGHLLDERDIPWVSFKGPVLAETAHRRPDLRAYVDLDLLVDGEDLPLALTTLEDAGCRLLERNWPRMGHLLPGQVHLLTPAQTLLDLHWHVLDDPALRRDARMDSSTLISRSRPVALPTGPVPTFDPADTVVHLCVHAAQSGGNRLIWLVDIDRALALTGLDEVVDRALEMRVGPAVEVMLRRARAVLGTPVATGQLRRLV